MKTLLGTALQGRYDDERLIEFEPCVNNEITLRMGDAEVMFVDALDLLRAVSEVAFLVHGPSATDQEPTDPAALARLQHRHRAHVAGWACSCGWEQDKPHAEHVADMVRAAEGGAA